MKRGSQHGFVRTLSVGGRLDRFVGVTRRNSYPQQTRMDYLSDFYAASPDLVEHSLMSNNIYDSSPTSLYMYEQEKVDMQNTLGNICSNVIQEVPTKKSKNEDFELKSQYEMSQDLCLNLGDSVQHESLPSNKESWQAGHLMCEKSTDVKLESFEPTLAELNTYSEENSLMSIGNLTELIGGSAAQSAENSNSDFIKSEPVISGCTWDNNAIIDTDREKQSLKVSAVKNWMLQTQTKGLQPLNDTDDHELKPELKGQPVELLALLGSTRGYSNKGVLPSSSRGQSCTTSTATRGKDTQALTSPTIGKSPDVSSATNVTKSSMPSQTFPTQVASLLSQLVPSGGKTLSPQVVSEESNSVDRKWEEIKHFLYDQEEKDIAKGQQTRSKRRSIVSQSSTISNEDSDDSDWDMQGVESDSESDGSQADWTTSQSTSKKPMHKDKQYFWQYNIQSKGPKGKRVNFGMDNNPHKLQGFEDPVFDTVTASQLGTSIKHGGKARKGDGNDIKPNPKKLVQIGTQLKRLNKQINGFVPLSELPASNRSKSKKEKNKLASRACRLKKKAQHEANKVKLHGLDCEHKQLLHVVSTLKQSLQKAVDESEAERKAMSYTSKLESLMEEYLTTRVAGSTTDYVNQVIKRVEEGDATGGLDLKRHH